MHTAIILDKPREPVAVLVRAELEKTMPATAREMQINRIAATFQYVVGRHGYTVHQFDDGAYSKPARIF